jgi:asparagine synthase (glutamine-hydrolysing)
MCSINGIVYFGKVSAQTLQKKMSLMQKVTRHRGPDESDLVIFDQAAIGMNRLSIVSPNEPTKMNEMEQEKKYVVFNGEIVNYKELRKILSHPPENLHSDTALILPLLKEFGQNFVKKLAGMFAIAIYDQQEEKLQLWRDPLGIKPLYYFYAKDHVIFSSEIKAIYAVMDEMPKVEFAGLDHILRHRFQPGRDTVFADIKKVLPGETITFRKDKKVHRQYWKLTNNKKTLSPNIHVDQFRNLLQQVVKEHAQADVRGGFFTSGGLDSSLITSMALQTESSPYKQPISVRFLPQSVADEEYGELLEKYLGTPFEWVTISDSLARDTLSQLIPYLDEPLENPTHIGTFLMAKRAKELGIKSVLTGDGSDEFFLGYERHACWFTNSDPVRAYPKLCWTMKPDEADELYTKEAKASLQPIVNGLGKPVESVLNMDQALMFERWERLTEYHNMRLDRMTMAHSVEARVPFLDHRIVEYALQIPHAILFGKTGKEWLQKVAKPLLPSEILNRPKFLFPSLPDQWLSGEGVLWAAKILLKKNAKIHKWIKPYILKKYIQEHKDGTHLRGKLLWAIIVLELWLREVASWKRMRKELV